MLTNAEQRKTEQAFWEHAYTGSIRYRLPSKLNVGTANFIRLLESHVDGGDRVLEIGFAPGKLLAYLALRRGAHVSGIDFLKSGVDVAKKLFSVLGIEGDLRCEDLFQSSFSEESFDVVYSLGVVEHFDNPKLVFAKHLQLLRPGGRGIIAIPNYGGVYGQVQSWLDPVNLAIHNLKIMNLEALKVLASGPDVDRAKVYAFGRVNGWLLSLDAKFPRPVAHFFQYLINAVGLIQPFDMAPLCPLLVVEFTKPNR
jgi:2-polyprenyl-3-methyl-5-hydroxy-6-metoxy-1,4-benzoquinol methylase